MKYTLLELVQTILSSMDSDEVNSINDTTEATQVATVVKTVYNNIVSRANLPEHYTLFELEPGGSDLPVVMYLPDDINDLIWLKYDVRLTVGDNPNYQKLTFVPLEEFINRMHSMNPGDPGFETTELTIGDDTFDLVFMNNRGPSYYTTYDDNTLVFDAYDSELESNLQKSKTIAYGEKIPVFVMEDEFVPDLDNKQFDLLLNEAKALAWAELKQTQHARAEVNAKRGWINLQRTKSAIDKRSNRYKLPNYGRK